MLVATSSVRDWMYRRIMPHVGHANHLCDLAESGRLSLNEMKTLVRDPNYICKKCGRVANKADSLCEPAPLYKNIVETAIASGSFNTLVAAVQAAGLVETLSGPGPLTVFAPTDEAFAKLPAGTVEALLKDKPKLTAILTYHVVAGKVMAADVMKLKSAKTVQGQDVSIDTTDGVKVNDAKVVKADIVCSNGVIHVIDKVILPS
jgi:uncharacterized surface protein with fasciclin (FAS1) repeats